MGLFSLFGKKKASGYQKFSATSRKVKNKTVMFKKATSKSKRNFRRGRGIFK